MLKRGIGTLVQGLLIFLIVVTISPSANAQQALLEVGQQDPHQVVLKLALPGKYQVLNLQNPERIFVYIYESSLRTDKKEIACSGEYIKYAKIYPFEGNFGTVRVEIGIADGLQYRDWIVDNEIYVWVGKQSEAPPPPPPPTAQPPVGAENPTETPGGELPASPPLTPTQPESGGAKMVLATRYMARPGSAPRATKVLDINVTPGNESTQLTINTDGPVKNFDDFILVNPNRLVIDVLDTKADFIQPRIDVTSQAVTAVRWGQHKDRSRIVIDLGRSGSAPYYQAKKIPSGIEVTVYSTKTADQAPGSDFTFHTVAAGENLQTIAQKAYGDPREWRRIVLANREKFPDANAVLDSEGLLYPTAGTVLKIPVR
jgi:nucleoid-associated protein YgaU